MRERLGRSLSQSVLLVAGTVAAGLAVWFVPLHLPAIVVKYGGSVLWALTIYWCVTALLPQVKVAHAALLAAAIASAVEFFKLYRSPAVDTFRGTLPGILLLGRFFSVWDLFAYGAAITLGAWADAAWLRVRRHVDG